MRNVTKIISLIFILIFALIIVFNVVAIVYITTNLEKAPRPQLFFQLQSIVKPTH